MFFFGKISSDQAVTSCLDLILRNSFWNIWVYQEFKVYIIFQKLFQPFMVEKLSMLCRVGLGCQLCTFSPTHHSRPWSSDNKINDWQRHFCLRSSSWTFNAFGMPRPRWSLPRAEESQPHWSQPTGLYLPQVFPFTQPPSCQILLNLLSL